MNACLEHLQDECIAEGFCSVRGQRLHASSLWGATWSSTRELRASSSNSRAQTTKHREIFMQLHLPMACM